MINVDGVTGEISAICWAAFSVGPHHRRESRLTGHFGFQGLPFLAGKKLPTLEASAQVYVDRMELGEAKFSRVTIEVY